MRDMLELITKDEGQTMVEYSIVVATLVIGVITVIGFVALAVTNKLGPVSTAIGSI